MRITPDTVVAVTGASRGIGRQAALAFAGAGADAVLLSRDREKMASVAAEISALGRRAEVIECDVSRREDCLAWVPLALKRFGRIDVLVNNAGFGLYAAIEDLTEEHLDGIFRTNLLGAIWCTQAVLPHMKEAQRGHIVNVSTVISFRSLPFMSAYCMTKAALNAMDEALRLEVKPYGIGVSLVCPGLTETDFAMNAVKERYRAPVTNRGKMPASKVGRAILKAVERRKRVVALTFAGRIMLFLQKISPSILDFALYRLMVRRFPPEKVE